MNKAYEQTQHVRRLVELFYDGVTSPEQEAVIVEYFRTTPLAELPEDLRAEADIFCVLETLNATVPNDIMAEIDGRIAVERLSPRPYLRFVRIAVGAAIIVAVGAAVFRIATMDEPVTAPITELVAEATPLPESLPHPSLEPVEQQAVAESKAVGLPRTVSHRPAAKPVSTPDNDGYTELTDPAEVAKVLAQIDYMMKSSMRTADHADRQVEQQLKSVDITLINTLKQL